MQRSHQQWLIAKRFGGGVTGVRVRARARVREWNYFFFFFSFSVLKWQTPLCCSPGTLTVRCSQCKYNNVMMMYCKERYMENVPNIFSDSWPNHGEHKVHSVLKWCIQLHSISATNNRLVCSEVLNQDSWTMTWRFMAVHRFMTGCEEVKVCLPIDDEVLSKLLSALQPVFPLTPWHRCISALVSSPDTTLSQGETVWWIKSNFLG